MRNTKTITKDDYAVIAKDVTVEFDVAEYKTSTLKEFILSKLKLNDNKTRRVKAVDNVSFTLNRGESLAIIGHNGSGKSTLLRAISGIISPKNGTIDLNGRIAPMIELGAGFDGELSGLENIRLATMIMGLTREEVEQKIDSIVAFSELEKFIHMPVKNYSSGMYARLGFACTTAVDPEILIVDEVLAVGDSNFTKKCLHRIDSLRSNGASVIIVSHDEGMIRTFCDRAIVMTDGKKIFSGSLEQAFSMHRQVMMEREKAAMG